MLPKMLIVIALVAAVALAAPTSDTKMPAPLKNVTLKGLEMLDSMIDKSISEGFKFDGNYLAFRMFSDILNGVKDLSSGYCYADRPANKIQNLADNLKQKADKLTTVHESDLLAVAGDLQRSNEACKEYGSMCQGGTQCYSSDMDDALGKLVKEFNGIVSSLVDKASNLDSSSANDKSKADEALRMLDWAQKYAALVDNFVAEVDNEGMTINNANGKKYEFDQIQMYLGTVEYYLEQNLPSAKSKATQVRNTVKQSIKHVQNIADRGQTY